MIKFRLYFDKDAETEWLNRMAAEGFAMTGFCMGFYHFDRCEPGKYIYQVDFGDHFFSASEDYREFMQDTGVEIIQNWGYWVFLRRLAEKGKFELYTDVDSSIEHYTKIRRMFKIVTVLELICFFFELFAAIAGNRWAYVCLFLLGAITLAFTNVIFRTNRIIEELKERKGEASAGCRNRQISVLLACGLLLNSCALVLEESIHPTAKLIVQLAAIVLMLAGIYRTMRYQCKDKSNDN